MAKIKGTAVKSTVTFFRERLGEEGFSKLVATLPPEEAQLFGTAILQGSWYSFSGFRRLMEAGGKSIPAPPNHSLAWELGRYSAEQGLNTVYRAFFRVADVGFIMKRATAVYPTYYDTGTLDFRQTGDRAATMTIRDFDEWCVPFCDRIQGWVEKLLEMTGSKRVIIRHPNCAARGGPYCEMCAEWA